jgi:hypothetical protein
VRRAVEALRGAKAGRGKMRLPGDFVEQFVPE